MEVKVGSPVKAAQASAHMRKSSLCGPSEIFYQLMPEEEAEPLTGLLMPEEEAEPLTGPLMSEEVAEPLTRLLITVSPSTEL